MEQNNTLIGEISRIIGKINKDWERFSAAGLPVSKIEKDIFLDDLRSVYLLISEIEIAKSAFSANKGPVDIPFEVFADEKPVTRPVAEEQKEAPVFQTENPLPAMPPVASAEYEKPLIEIAKETVNVAPTPEIIIEKKPEIIVEEVPEAKSTVNELPLPELKPEPSRPEPKHSQPQTKMMVDLFTPQKTVSDVLHGNGDKTVAAKIQNNHITDLKAAIGINDKFTFVNDIFKGEISRYNHAIDHFNTLDTLQDAEDYISRQGLRSGSPENLAALTKLTDLLKRKYQL